MKEPFKILSEEMLIDEPHCRIKKETLLLPNGKKKDWYIKIGNGVAMVLPILEDGSILIQKIYRHPIRKYMYETPAGQVDEGESPEEAIKREMLEETGYASDEWTYLGGYYSHASFKNSKLHIFVAENCKKVAEQELGQDELIETSTLPNLKTFIEFMKSDEADTHAATFALIGLLPEEILTKYF